MTFRTWLPTTYESQVQLYRLQADVVVATSRQWAEGNIWEPRHSEAAISCLPAIPAMPKYQGEVSEADKEWYKTCLKPDWKAIRKEYEDQIRKLCLAD